MVLGGYIQEHYSPQTKRKIFAKKTSLSLDNERTNLNSNGGNYNSYFQNLKKYTNVNSGIQHPIKPKNSNTIPSKTSFAAFKDKINIIKTKVKQKSERSGDNITVLNEIKTTDVLVNKQRDLETNRHRDLSSNRKKFYQIFGKSFDERARRSRSTSPNRLDTESKPKSQSNLLSKLYPKKKIRLSSYSDFGDNSQKRLLDFNEFYDKNKEVKVNLPGVRPERKSKRNSQNQYQFEGVHKVEPKLNLEDKSEYKFELVSKGEIKLDPVTKLSPQNKLDSESKLNPQTKFYPDTKSKPQTKPEIKLNPKAGLYPEIGPKTESSLTRGFSSSREKINGDSNLKRDNLSKSSDNLYQGRSNQYQENPIQRKSAATLSNSTLTKFNPTKVDSSDNRRSNHTQLSSNISDRFADKRKLKYSPPPDPPEKKKGLSQTGRSADKADQSIGSNSLSEMQLPSVRLCGRNMVGGGLKLKERLVLGACIAVVLFTLMLVVDLQMDLGISGQHVVPSHGKVKYRTDEDGAEGAYNSFRKRFLQKTHRYV